MSYDKYYQARDTIFEFIHKDAFGPIKVDEVLEMPPLDTYVCGILWPKRTQTHTVSAPAVVVYETAEGAAPDANFGSDMEEEQSDVIREANQFRPSVMAVSFAVNQAVKQVKVCFSAGRYENIDKPVEGKKYILHDYRRIPMDTGCFTLELPVKSKRFPVLDGRAVMQVVRRRSISQGRTLWTLSIENAATASQNEIEQNIYALFQCKLTIQSDFEPIDDPDKSSRNAERKKQDFLYRNRRSFASGHGCSAEWESKSGLVTEIRSTFLPKAVVSQMIAVTDDHFTCFRMSSWVDAYKNEMLTQFEAYIKEYSGWKNRLSAQLEEVSNTYRETARDILSKIEICLQRLQNGVTTLRTNPLAWKAFCLMNRAMMRQSAKKRKQAETVVSWYPFQLCYVMMCVPDVSDVRSDWRDAVDLLWFPTGGGKTEAYLGVAAFTIFYRRLTKGEAGRGVTVLMRYTLRMLTAQQFERASALICECDVIRREEHLAGGEISIGLWVGSAVTPNHVTSDREDMESAESILKKLQTGSEEDVTASPVQLSVCPYCGTKLLPQNAYAVAAGRFHAHCPNPQCPFHGDLPVVTVDDDIYTRRPTLLIGTIDKFARLAWEEKTGAIFAEDGVGLPPELLIQDELHLISGPLGSISGLYEIAIEKLCSRNGVKPKILASTATLCNASEQIRALYGKEMFQFPPSGFDADDSYFARSADSSEKPQRQYVGYCETGGSLSDSIVQVFGVVRFALEYLIGIGTDTEVIDHFWTNVGYFNSLKDLGSADTLLIDRVRSYAESLRLHKFKEEAAQVEMKPISSEYEYGELTSRKSARQITEVRNQLDRQHYPSPAAFQYILSSNMLSVGIDIDRLGLMTVYGQPKATAEYIQATSRVGRSNPGFVFVLLHMLRTRDKSHFEQFQTYHQSLNKMVEPTSATPYACRTLDKALHAVFVTLVRHLCPELRGNRDAAKFRSDSVRIEAIMDELLTMIEERSEETADYAGAILDDFAAQWDEAAAQYGAQFQYQLLNRSENDTFALLIPAERSENALFPPTMNSMRNVDTQSGVYLKG